MQEFHPSNIRRLVFDLDSLSAKFNQDGWENFRQFLLILDDRDFEIVLISESISASDWSTINKLSVLESSAEIALKNNASLTGNDVFWLTEQPVIQTKLANCSQNYAGSNTGTAQTIGLQYLHLHDMLQIFHPSKITAADFAATLAKLKQKSPQVPLMLGIGGPDECGHDFFVGELIDALEDHEQLVSGLDLTQLLGTEFYKQTLSKDKTVSSYWNSEEIQNWVFTNILTPYTQGQQVYLEKPPAFIQDYEISSFPFFLAPEMILLVWGTTVFLPEFENIMDVRVLLELSPKTAAARIFALDDRVNFDQTFVDTYQEKEGKIYADYLKQFNVINQVDYRIDFENFNAFRMKENN
ncbi:MAG: hypothetical protein H8E38_07925 [SAR324 cluster bacterium]|nr:hypothetical protein [SAR324 cluster bacterium]MBL7035936.1 hypothetical protein [SAR324 cluster bacterium]